MRKQLTQVWLLQEIAPTSTTWSLWQTKFTTCALGCQTVWLRRSTPTCSSSTSPRSKGSSRFHSAQRPLTSSSRWPLFEQKSKICPSLRSGSTKLSPTHCRWSSKVKLWQDSRGAASCWACRRRTSRWQTLTQRRQQRWFLGFTKPEPHSEIKHICVRCQSDGILSLKMPTRRSRRT